MKEELILSCGGLINAMVPVVFMGVECLPNTFTMVDRVLKQFTNSKLRHKKFELDDGTREL